MYTCVCVWTKHLFSITYIQRNFLYSSTDEKKTFHLVRLDTVTKPKNQRGLGLPNSHWKNSSFHAAFAWHYKKEKESLPVNTLHNKCDNLSPLGSSLNREVIGSHVWRIIKKGSIICNAGTKWLVGNSKFIISGRTIELTN